MEARQEKLESMLLQQTDMLAALLQQQGISAGPRTSRASHSVVGSGQESRELQPLAPGTNTCVWARYMHEVAWRVSRLTIKPLFRVPRAREPTAGIR